MDLPGLHATTLAQAYPIAKFDLTLSVAEQDGQLHCEWEYATALFDGSTIARWAGHLDTLLAGIVAQPDSALQHLPLLSAAERQQLQAWNETAVDYPKDQTIVSLFEAQVHRTPDNTAVVFGDQYPDLRGTQCPCQPGGAPPAPASGVHCPPQRHYPQPTDCPVRGTLTGHGGGVSVSSKRVARMYRLTRRTRKNVCNGCYRIQQHPYY